MISKHITLIKSSVASYGVNYMFIVVCVPLCLVGTIFNSFYVGIFSVLNVVCIFVRTCPL